MLDLQCVADLQLNKFIQSHSYLSKLKDSKLQSRPFIPYIYTQSTSFDIFVLDFSNALIELVCIASHLRFLTNNCAISSKLRPFVSGTTAITNTTANAQNIEYIQNVPAVVISCVVLFSEYKIN